MRYILFGSILFGALLAGGFTADDSFHSTHGPPLFRSYCASCHGVDGRGGGPVSKSLKSAPPDLTRISARNGGVFPDVRVSKIISGEGVAFGAHGSQDMPVWGPVFSIAGSDRDLGRTRIENLVQYLRDIQKR
ncbi:MAG TPA: cytochrome c [Bryobacteraceae bacterium]|jgi:mono/diheme cytochrome c family protein|nr:cytochrome c [Bryobacteraceae bacterium]